MCVFGGMFVRAFLRSIFWTVWDTDLKFDTLNFYVYQMNPILLMNMSPPPIQGREGIIFHFCWIFVFYTESVSRSLNNTEQITILSYKKRKKRNVKGAEMRCTLFTAVLNITKLVLVDLQFCCINFYVSLQAKPHYLNYELRFK